MTYFEQLTQRQVESQVKNQPLANMYDQIILQTGDQPLYQIQGQIRHVTWIRVQPLVFALRTNIRVTLVVVYAGSPRWQQ